MARPYKIICVSIYPEDLAKMDAKVEELKRRGWVKPTRSHLIREAIDRVDIDALAPTPVEVSPPPAKTAAQPGVVAAYMALLKDVLSKEKDSSYETTDDVYDELDRLWRSMSRADQLEAERLLEEQENF